MLHRKRLICLLKILEEETDVRHFLTLKEIADLIDSRYPDIEFTLPSIRQDLETLKELIEMGIIPFYLSEENGAHNERKYALYRPNFGINEARLVFDSISVSAFLSERQKKDLLSEMNGFLSRYEVNELRQRVKTKACILENPNLPETLNEIYRAIREKKILAFDYVRFDLKGHQDFCKHYERIQPLEVIWSQNHYYLAAFNLEYKTGEQRRNYRIDRIQNPVLIKGKRERYDPAALRLGQFDMFSSNHVERVTFRVEQRLWDMVLEQFGFGISRWKDPDKDNWVRFIAEVEISGGFYRWVLKQGPYLEVLNPPEIREGVKQQLRETLRFYESDNSCD